MKTHALKELIVLVLAMLTPYSQIAQPGFPNSDFGTNGTAVVDAQGDFDILNDLVILSNGDIVAVGETRINNIAEDYLIVKVNRDGMPVQSFGNNGLIQGDFEKLTDSPVRIAVNESEDLYIAVQAYSQELSKKSDFVIKYKSSGQIDSSFADKGIFYIEGGKGGWNLTEIAIAPGGSIFGAAEGSDSISIFKLEENGTSDSSFGHQGTLRLPKENFGVYRVTDIKFQKGFRVVLAGFKRTMGVEAKFFMMRMDGNGKIDSSFAQNGFIQDNLFGSNKTYAYDLAIQSDDKLLLAGGHNDGQKTEAILLRYNYDGSLDTSFGNNGYLKYYVFDSRYYSILAMEDNSCVAGGDYILMKFLADGKLDPNFGNIDVGTTGSFDLLISKLDLDHDGNIVAIGSYDSKLAISKFEFGQSTSVKAFTDYFGAMIYPNPTQDHINVSFLLDHPQKVTIDLLDTRGVLLARLDNSLIQKGLHKGILFFNPYLDPGIYLIRIKGDEGESITKMIKY